MSDWQALGKQLGQEVTPLLPIDGYLLGLLYDDYGLLNLAVFRYDGAGDSVERIETCVDSEAARALLASGEVLHLPGAPGSSLLTEEQLDSLMIQDCVAFPLLWRQEPVGFVALYTSQGELVLDDGALAFARLIADHVAPMVRDVRLFEGLSASGRRYRAIVEQSHVGVLVVDDEHRFQYVNDQLCHILDRPSEDLLGHDFREFLPPGSRDLVDERYRQRQEGLDVPERYLFQIVRPDGEERDVEIISSAMPADGDRMQTVAQILDVTERERNRAQMQELLQFRERIIDNRVAWLVALDRGGRVRLWNQAAERGSGYASEEALAWPAIWDAPIFGDAGGQQRQEAYEALLASSETVNSYEIKVRCKDGTERVISWDWQPLLDESEAVSGLMAVGRDVTERRRAEEDLAQERYLVDMMMEHAPEVIYFKDREGRFIRVNRFAAEQGGFDDPSEVVGMTDADLYPDEHAEEARSLEEQVMATGEPIANVEERQVEEDGTVTWGLVTRAPLRDREDNIVGILGLARDITERKRLEAELRQSQKMEAIGQLAGGVAHDFNNLLTIINGYSEYLLGTLPPDAEREELEQIYEAGQRAARLTQQLLAFSRRQRLKLEILDINTVVGNLLNMLSRLLGEQILVQVQLADDLRRVEADRGQLEQVIMNLAVNARDAMPTGGRLTIRTANVDVGSSRASQHLDIEPGQYVLLSIGDSGVGMSDEIREHLFEPFFTTKPEGEGTGLGLATVYGIVKQLGGSIYVYSEEGEGSTFKIYLSACGVAVAEERVEEQALPTGSEVILVIEDAIEVRRLTVRMLERLGYAVYEAEDLEQALAVCRRESIDLVLSDVIMPHVSGPRIVDRLRQDRPGLPVLYVSGYADRDVEQRGRLDARAELIEKPFGLADLAHRVRQVLAGEGDA